MKKLWILNDLYVASDGRKQGVARVLIDRARQLAIDTRALKQFIRVERVTAGTSPVYQVAVIAVGQKQYQ